MRESITILLHKKDDAHLITNYRPIALTQALCKTYASILSKRLVKFLGLNPALLDDAQTGFLPSRGVSQKLLAITTAFSEANRDKTELHLQSNDFYKCFDSIEHWYLKLCLEHMKLPAQFIGTVMDTLKHLTTRFRIAGSLTDPISISRGVRQGDPLSAILCVCALDPLLRVINAKARHDFPDSPLFGAHAYADDFDLLFPTAASMQAAFDEFKRVAAAASLSINPGKCSYTFSPHTPAAAQLSLHVPDPVSGEDTPIPTVQPHAPVKVLGVLLSASEDWSHQKRLTLSLLNSTLRKLKPRAINEVQYVETVNVMILAMVTYPMCVVPYTEIELAALDKIVVDATKARLRLQDNYHDDFLHLPPSVQRLRPPVNCHSLRRQHTQRPLSGPKWPALPSTACAKSHRKTAHSEPKSRQNIHSLPLDTSPQPAQGQRT
jgi:hypothetical protein